MHALQWQLQRLVGYLELVYLVKNLLFLVFCITNIIMI